LVATSFFEKREVIMIIDRAQLIGLEEGDVLVVNSPYGQKFYFAVLERNQSKVFLSATENRAEDLLPVRNIAWKYLVVDDAGDMYDDKDKEVTPYFLGGKILKGMAKNAAKEYRTRIMPNMKIVRNGIVQIPVAEGRVPEVKKNLRKIQCVVFNNEYGDSTAVLFEMFSRAIRGTPPEELPLYLDHLYKAVRNFEKMKEMQLVRIIASEVFFSDEQGVVLTEESAEVIRKMMEGNG